MKWARMLKGIHNRIHYSLDTRNRFIYLISTLPEVYRAISEFQIGETNALPTLVVVDPNVLIGAGLPVLRVGDEWFTTP